MALVSREENEKRLRENANNIRSQKEQEEIWRKNRGNVRSNEEQEKIWRENGKKFTHKKTDCSAEIHKASAAPKDTAAFHVRKLKNVSSSQAQYRVNGGSCGGIAISDYTFTATRLSNVLVWIELSFAAESDVLPNGAIINYGSSYPVSDDTLAVVPVAQIATSGNFSVQTITNYLSGSLQVHRCGDSLFYWRI